MKTNTFSIVVGTDACDMNCPYCVSKMTCTAAPKSQDINWDRFHTACRIVDKAADGLISVLLTGKGEPCLYPDQITAYLVNMVNRFPLVDLQTNGQRIAMGDGWVDQLSSWRRGGLTLVCVSIAHWDPHRSAFRMGGKPDYDYRVAIDKIKAAGLACRLNCTMTRGSFDRPGDVDALINTARKLEVEQLTIREVTRPAVSISPQVYDWVGEHTPGMTASRLYYYLRDMLKAKELLRLPHGASVFDVDGQNVCVNNCLTQDTDPDNIRQIIFFPDGRISYDWCYPGARIL